MNRRGVLTDEGLAQMQNALKTVMNSDLIMSCFVFFGSVLSPNNFEQNMITIDVVESFSQSFARIGHVH